MPGAVTAGGKWINHGDIPTHFYAVCALCGHIGEGKLRQYTDDDRCHRCQGLGQAFLDEFAHAARVRSAAPDLLMALGELVDLMEAVRSGEYLPDSFTTQPARAAIAKATGSTAPIEASQAGGQPPDVVQVPREVYDVVLKRLDYIANCIHPWGDTHDAVVREHERLKMCAATAERS